jgi:hypothetical protein
MHTSSGDLYIKSKNKKAVSPKMSRRVFPKFFLKTSDGIIRSRLRRGKFDHSAVSLFGTGGARRQKTKISRPRSVRHASSVKKVTDQSQTPMVRAFEWTSALQSDGRPRHSAEPSIVA